MRKSLFILLVSLVTVACTNTKYKMENADSINKLENNSSKEKDSLYWVDCDGHYDPLDKFMALINDEDTSLETITDFLDEQTDLQQLNEARDGDFCSFLHYAAEEGELETVQYLKEKGVPLNIRSSPFQRTPLMLAARWGMLGVIKYLLDINPDYLKDRDRGGATALFYAVANDELAVVKYFIEQAGVSLYEEDNKGWSILHVAARYDFDEMVRYIVQQDKEGILIKKTVNHRGNVCTPYDIAKTFQNISMASWLESASKQYHRSII